VRILDAVAVTHQGARRPDNEDAVLRLAAPMVLAVADGMGGAENGRRAAELAVGRVRDQFPRLRTQLAAIGKDRSTQNRLALSTLLDEVFNSASKAILAEKETREAGGAMGSTLTMATVVGNHAYLAHVGNSRGYLVRQGKLVRLTEDHSLAEFRFRRGRITREEYATSPDRNVLYQALGAGVDVEVDAAEVRLLDGDVVLLCSDGLTRALTETTIAVKVDRSDLAGSARLLVLAALDAGADDNVSVALASVASEEGDEPIETLTDALKAVFLFEHLSDTERLVIAPYLEEAVFAKGAVIFQEGDPADSFFVLAAGKVRVTRGGTQLTDVREGGHFGEMALARPTTRSATVKALQPTRVFVLGRERFQEILRHKPDLGAKLALALLDGLGDRLRDLSDRLSAVERAARGDLR